MTTPPNYRRVECCGNCLHYQWMMVVACWKHGKFPKEDGICDDYEPGDGE